MPPEWNSGASSFCPVCDSVSLWLSLSVCDSVCLWLSLSVCDSVAKNVNLGLSFWTIKERDFIFGMHTQLMKQLKWHHGQWPCDFDHDLHTKNSQFWTLLPPGEFVFRKHINFHYTPDKVGNRCIMVWHGRLYVGLWVCLQSLYK